MQEMRGDVQLTTDAENSAAGQEPAAAEEKPKRTRTRRTASGESAPQPRTRRRTAAATTEEAAPAAEVAVAEAEEAAPASGGGTTRRRSAPKRSKPVVEQRPLPRLLGRYREEIQAQLINEFGYASSMQAPEVKKVVLNVGLGEALTNSRALETTPGHVAAITGQKPVITKARTSVAGFKVREGQSVGVMVTLRGRRMYEFLDRMISTALPRIRDFRGVPRDSFDGRGNYALGFREQIVFPEIDYGSVDRVRGFQVIITTSARTDAEGFRLLELMGMPFARAQTN